GIQPLPRSLSGIGNLKPWGAAEIDALGRNLVAPSNGSNIFGRTGPIGYISDKHACAIVEFHHVTCIKIRFRFTSDNLKIRTGIQYPARYLWPGDRTLGYWNDPALAGMSMPNFHRCGHFNMQCAEVFEIWRLGCGVV